MGGGDIECLNFSTQHQISNLGCLDEGGECFSPVVADEGGGETGLRANPGMHVLLLWWRILVIRKNW